jgi:hypothetical protein
MGGVSISKSVFRFCEWRVAAGDIIMWAAAVLGSALFVIWVLLVFAGAKVAMLLEEGLLTGVPVNPPPKRKIPRLGSEPELELELELEVDVIVEGGVW